MFYFRRRDTLDSPINLEYDTSIWKRFDIITKHFYKFVQIVKLLYSYDSWNQENPVICYIFIIRPN